MIRLLIADDEALERETLADIVARRFEHEVTIETAENGRKAADTAVLWGADLILMDIEMPGMNGLDAARAVLEQLKNALAKPGERWEHIGVYNVAARLRLLDERSHLEICSHPGRGTAIRLYLPLIEPEEEDLDDDPIVDC